MDNARDNGSRHMQLSNLLSALQQFSNLYGAM